MKSVPVVSILMPVRNEELYLVSALESIYRQTFTDWELIVVDDGSTDATPVILENAAVLDRRVRVITQGSGGIVTALNTGLSACRSPYIARMDGDDLCHPGRLESQVAFLEANPDIGLVACAFRHFPRETLKQGFLSYEAWQNSLVSHDLIMRDLFVESPFVHPSIMTRRDLLLRLGGYRNEGWPEDYDLWLRMAADGVRFAKLPQQHFFWRDHPERSTRTLDDYSRKAFRACKAHHLRLGYLKDATQVVVAGAGLEGRAWQRQLSLFGIKVSCWLDIDPRKLGKTLHGAPVITPGELRLNDEPLLVAIGVAGAREEFRLLAHESGLRDGLDFVCVA